MRSAVGVVALVIGAVLVVQLVAKQQQCIAAGAALAAAFSWGGTQS